MHAFENRYPTEQRHTPCDKAYPNESPTATRSFYKQLNFGFRLGLGYLTPNYRVNALVTQRAFFPTYPIVIKANISHKVPEI